ncbi:chromate transporter [Ferviditalea candida]|uniref:Chromate transporter n=1 Tax=Ferviditalea candida TaxID=3108399 RepID=A0ABU5ZKY6_9BACL|nr:chromate transporter [Paenibacillaceae bacterium T2]
MQGTYKEIMIAMIRTGIIGYGGGPSIIPLIRHEAVIKYKWINDDEFSEILALANALPGPIATKMAAYLGYRVKGAMGALVSVLFHILPTVIAMISLVSVLYIFGQSKYIKGMVGAVRPVITVMLGMMAYEFVQKTWKGLGKALGMLFGVLAFLLLAVIPINPAFVVILFLLYGAFHLRLLEGLSNKKRSAEKDV